MHFHISSPYPVATTISKEYIENVKKEEFENGKTAGIEIGKSEGQLLLMRKLISQGKISSEEGARILNVDENILQ